MDATGAFGRLCPSSGREYPRRRRGRPASLTSTNALSLVSQAQQWLEQKTTLFCWDDGSIKEHGIQRHIIPEQVKELYVLCEKHASQQLDRCYASVWKT